MNIEENVSLKNLTTFKIGGNARYFTAVETIEDLSRAVGFAKEKNIPFFVLGGGSNVLVSDSGFPGLVIRINMRGINQKDLSSGMVEVIVGAGENWDSLVAYAVLHGLYGIENLSFIPGSVGAAPVQNIGAYGSEVKDTLHSVEVLDSNTGEVKTLLNEDCKFSYRDSIFKRQQGKHFIITKVTFVLNKNGTLRTEYKDVKSYIEKHGIANIDLPGLRQAVISIRKAKLPDVSEYGTAGSFFKNPIIQKSRYEELQALYPLLPVFPLDEERVKIPIAWVLDNVCDFKGVRRGDVGVYQNQALVLVNFANGTAEEIIRLAAEMERCVKEKTGIDLEREVNFIQ